MSKVQSYIYLAVLVLVLLLGVVFWADRQGKVPDGNEEPVVDLTDNSIDTTNWKTFKHEVYPYEIKYPVEAEVEAVSAYKDDGAQGLGNGQINFFSKNSKNRNSFVILADYAGSNTNMDSNFNNIEDYVKKQRGEALGTDDGGHMVKLVNNVEKIIGNNWQGYQYSFTQGYTTDERDWVTTRLFIVHGKILYEIFYDKTYPVHRTMLGSLRFLD